MVKMLDIEFRSTRNYKQTSMFLCFIQENYYVLLYFLHLVPTFPLLRESRTEATVSGTVTIVTLLGQSRVSRRVCLACFSPPTLEKSTGPAECRGSPLSEAGTKPFRARRKSSRINPKEVSEPSAGSLTDPWICSSTRVDAEAHESALDILRLICGVLEKIESCIVLFFLSEGEDSTASVLEMLTSRGLSPLSVDSLVLPRRRLMDGVLSIG